MPPKHALVPFIRHLPQILESLYPGSSVLKCLCAPQTRPHSLHLPMLPFARPSLETHTVSRIRAVPPQENPKSHPSDARTTNSAAQGTKVQFWIDLGIISEPSDRQKPQTFNEVYCKSSISGLCGSCRSRIVPGPHLFSICCRIGRSPHVSLLLRLHTQCFNSSCE